MLFLKGKQEYKVLTAQEMVEAVVKDHVLVVPFYDECNIRSFIIQPRGTIFGNKGKRQEIIDV